jgi:hypothetical protein
LSAFHEQLSLHGRDRADDGEDQGSRRSGRVDAEVDDLQPNMLVVEMVEQPAEVAGVAPEAGQLDHDQGVAGSEVAQAGVRLWAVGAALTGRGLGEDPVAAEGVELVELAVEGFSDRRYLSEQSMAQLTPPAPTPIETRHDTSQEVIDTSNLKTA